MRAIVWLSAIVGAVHLAAQAPAQAPSAPHAPDYTVPLVMDFPMVIGPSLPLVHVTVRDQDTWLVVDTGSNAFSVTPLFAATLGVDMHPSTIVHSSSGESIPVPRAPAMAARFDNGTAFTLDPLIAASLPQGLTRLGIDGILSPQRLAAGDRDVLIDFPASQMAVGPAGMFSTNVAPADEIPMLAGSAICGSPALSRYTVPVSISGRTWRFLLDTGANQTNIVASSPLAALVSLQPDRSTSRGVASATLAVKGQAAVDIGVGDSHKSILAAVVTATPSCGVDGLLGFDFLRTCRIVLTHAGVGLSFRRP
jgi:hypothetical protein